MTGLENRDGKWWARRQPIVAAFINFRRDFL
jgi:hypothetical protein